MSKLIVSHNVVFLDFCRFSLLQLRYIYTDLSSLCMEENIFKNLYKYLTPHCK